MSIYYPAGCDALPVHTCNDCGVPLNGEMGRIRSMAIIQKDYALDPTSLSSWTTGITSGDIIIIPETTGSFDGGKAKKGPGYGDTVETYLGSDPARRGQLQNSFPHPNLYPCGRRTVQF